MGKNEHEKVSPIRSITSLILSLPAILLNINFMVSSLKCSLFVFIVFYTKMTIVKQIYFVNINKKTWILFF